MSTLCWAVCKALIEKQPALQRKKLIELLPPSQQAELKTAPTQKALFSALSPDEILDKIHPSWLMHFLQPYKETEQIFFLAALSPFLGTQIKKNLSIQKPLPTLSTLGKDYLRGELLRIIKKERGEALPKSALPESELNILLTFDAYRLSSLAFWLGLYDLAEELRFVIDKQTLQRIETALSPTEWQMVKTFQSKKERLSFGRMSIKNYLEPPSKLRVLIEQHGMNRLAKALYGEHGSLLWHLSLLVDPKRADFLSRFCTPLSKPELKETLQQQILSLIRSMPDGSRLNEQKQVES